jgi:hypothetical protein
VTEAGGFGTAAVVSSVGSYVFDDGTELRVGDGRIGPHTRRVYEVLTGIQRGKRSAPEGWLFRAPHLETGRSAGRATRRVTRRAASPARPKRSATARSARSTARRRPTSRSRR